METGLNEAQAILAELGGGGAAAIALTRIARESFGIGDRFLPILALAFGWVVAVLVALTIGPVGVESIIAGFFAGIGAVGLHQTVKHTMTG